MPNATYTTESAHKSLISAYDRRVWQEFINDEVGWEGRKGGWIYDQEGRPVEQGYQRLYMTRPDLRTQYREWLCEKAIGASTFRGLLPTNTLGQYRPTIRPRTKYHKALADEYDAVNNQGRRAFRGQKHEQRA